MDGLNKNILASFFSKGSSALLAIVCVPIYVRYLGVEAYGVISVFVTLGIALSLLDLGLGAAFTRQVANDSQDADQSTKLPTLLRTLEVIYWIMAGLIAVGVWLLAPLIAKYWLRLGALSVKDVGSAIGIAGLSFAMLWPSALYTGGITGLQKQVMLGWITTGMSLLKVLITLLGLWLLSPTLKTFFIAQACANLIQTLCMGSFLWKCIPSTGQRPSFQPTSVRTLLRFAGGMTGISVASALLMQTDKLILSKTLPTESFGYYAIAGTLASGLYILITPLFWVLFPEFCRLVGNDDKPSLTRLYHFSCQLISVVVLPVAAVIAFFARDLLLLWTHDAKIAASSAVLLSLMSVGNALNGLVNVPYGVQLAFGWTKLALYWNLIAIFFSAPAVYFLSIHIGAIAGPIVWAAYGCITVFLNISLSHRKFPLGRQSHWYLTDFAIPALSVIVVVGSWRLFGPQIDSRLLHILYLGLVAGMAFAVAVFAAPDVRVVALRLIRKFLRKTSIAFGSN